MASIAQKVKRSRGHPARFDYMRVSQPCCWLALLEHAIVPHLCCCHLLTGDDLSIKKNAKIDESLEKNNGKEFAGIWEMGSPTELLLPMRLGD